MPHELLTSEQMDAADRLTTGRGTAGFVLMQRAGQGAAAIIRELYKPQKTLVLCGPGNNGGDGYIIARLLKDAGFDVSVWSLVPDENLNGDARKAFEFWGGKCDGVFENQPLIVDAVFGTGFNKELEDQIVSLFKQIEKSKSVVIAVDIPSGVCGSTGEAAPATLKATHTITFARKKIGHCLVPGRDYCGRVHIVDIGVSQNAVGEAGFAAFENHPDLWKAQFPHKKPDDHKYKHGHAVIVGATKMTGATRLAAEACARIGAGLTTVIAPQEAGGVYRRTLPPHVIVEDRGNGLTGHLADDRRNAVLIGPGAGLEDVAALQTDIIDVLKSQKMIVLDADAITAFQTDREKLYSMLNKRCILTPHEGEFSRLFPGMTGIKTKRAQEAARRTGAIIVVKGPDTVIAAPDGRLVVNTNAPPWLATAGTGDVLAGIVTGLAAQGMESFDAACAAVWMHGEAARLFGEGLVASDITSKIPEVLREIA